MPPETLNEAAAGADAGVSVSNSSFETAGLGNPGLTAPRQIADSSDSVPQGTTDPRQGNKSHLLRSR